ncbi:MAG: I78 family peptidase inhibitor [Paracoccaceae bacterium]
MARVSGPAAFAMVVLFAGCVPETGPSAPANTVPAACGAAELQNMVGMPASAAETATFRQTTRIIRPMTPITEDYSEERLNFDIDANEKISRIWCG